MFAYWMNHLFSYWATLQAPPEVIGPVPEGIRANFYVVGGEFGGPRLHGRLRLIDAAARRRRRARCARSDRDAGGRAHRSLVSGLRRFRRGRPREVPARRTALDVGTAHRAAHPDYEFWPGRRADCVGTHSARRQQVRAGIWNDASGYGNSAVSARLRLTIAAGCGEEQALENTRHMALIGETALTCDLLDRQ